MKNPAVIVWTDEHHRVHLRLHLLEPERDRALWQIRTALRCVGDEKKDPKNHATIREALKRLQFVRESGWVIDDALREVEAVHREYVNTYYGDT